VVCYITKIVFNFFVDTRLASASRFRLSECLPRCLVICTIRVYIELSAPFVTFSYKCVIVNAQFWHNFIVVSRDVLVNSLYYTSVFKPWSSQSERAYHEDLWWRMVLDKTFVEISENLCVQPSIVKRIVDQFKSTGNICKMTYCKNGLLKKLTPTVEMVILTIVVQQPGIKLKKMQAQLVSMELK